MAHPAHFMDAGRAPLGASLASRVCVMQGMPGPAFIMPVTLSKLIFSPDGCHHGSPSGHLWHRVKELGAEFGHPPRAGRLQGWGCSFSGVARRFTALERLQASLGEEY